MSQAINYYPNTYDDYFIDGKSIVLDDEWGLVSFVFLTLFAKAIDNKRKKDINEGFSKIQDLIHSLLIIKYKTLQL